MKTENNDSPKDGKPSSVAAAALERIGNNRGSPLNIGIYSSMTKWVGLSASHEMTMMMMVIVNNNNGWNDDYGNVKLAHGMNVVQEKRYMGIMSFKICLWKS